MIENMYGFNLLEFNPAGLRDAQELYPDLEAQTDAFIAANPDFSTLCVELLRASASNRRCMPHSARCCGRATPT